MSRIALLCALVASATVLASAQDVRRVDVSKLGPQVGATVPPFNLSDQLGTKRTLQSVMGPKGAMIVFHRSADWCPYCKTQLLELQSQYDRILTRHEGHEDRFTTKGTKNTKIAGPRRHGGTEKRTY